jgi:pimeloyl-ACP methyl ester carboxylesterase
VKEEVTFTNNRGVRLVAHIIGLEKGEIRPVVIFAHGLNSSKDSPRNLYIAEGLIEKGFCCFLFDFTGHGESGGGISDVTVCMSSNGFGQLGRMSKLWVCDFSLV